MAKNEEYVGDHKPIEDAHRELMNEVAGLLDKVFAGYGWTLLVFDFHRHDGRMNYISNAQRADMLVAMKEFIARNEGRALDSGERH